MIRPLQPADLPAVQQILLDNGERLRRFGVSHYGEPNSDRFDWRTNVVFEWSGEIQGCCQFYANPHNPKDAIVPCFVIAVKHHDHGAYVRCNLNIERYIKAQGFDRIIAMVPPGHAKFKGYLIFKRKYVPYAEQGETLFLVKDLQGVRPWDAVVQRA